MISLLMQNYFNVLLAISLVCLSIFTSGLFFIFKCTKKPKALTLKKSLEEVQFIHENIAQQKQSSVPGSGDVTAIAGEDITSTHLDLARAYIEIDNKAAAKKILQDVLTQGSQAEKQEAFKLLDLIAETT